MDRPIHSSSQSPSRGFRHARAFGSGAFMVTVMLLTLLVWLGLWLALRPPAPKTGANGVLAASIESGQVPDAAAVERGREAFLSACLACHGENGEARPGLGKDISTSEFVAAMSNDELAMFLKKGRDPGDPLNTTGIGMPPKGGNPAITDAQLIDIVAFIRSLQLASK